VRSTWSVVLTFLHFPHNLALLSVLYISERPEMSSHGEKSKKANTRKGNYFMKNQNIMFTRSVPKMSKARLFRSVLALGVVALILHASLPRAQAYDLSSLNGSYADSFAGFFPVSPGSPHNPPPIDVYGPVNEAGFWTFDG